MSFNKLMDEVTKATIIARRDDEIRMLKNRIRRCEELLLYVVAMQQIKADSDKVELAIKIDIQFINDELGSWKNDWMVATSYEELIPIIIQTKAYIFVCLNELCQTEHQSNETRRKLMWPVY